MGTKRKRTAVAVLAGLLWVTAAQAAETYDLDVILPLTGGAALSGDAGRRTLLALQSMVNRRGGLRGKSLNFRFHDTATNPQNAVTIFREIAASGAPVVLGPQITAECAAVAPLIPRGPVSWCFSPGIHPAAGGFMFASFASTTDLIATMIRFLRLKGWTRIATLVTTDASGQDAQRSIVEALKAPENASMRLVQQQTVNTTDVSMAAQIARIKEAEPEVIIGWAIGAPQAAILRAISDAGLTQPVVIGQGNALYSFVEQFAALLPKELYFPENLGTIRGGAFDLPAPVAQARADYFAALDAVGAKADVGGESVWDAGVTVVEVLRRLGDQPTAQQIHDAIEASTALPGVSGVGDFSQHVQRAYGPAQTAMARWDARTGLFEAASGRGDGRCLSKQACSFLKKRTKKPFPIGPRSIGRPRTTGKVFWFFFSKKNRFPYPAVNRKTNPRQISARKKGNVMASDSFDTVVIGAGHNGLIAAAYLAKAGHKLLVLDQNEWIGGGVLTQEITVPGFRHDIHSSNHVFIQANPVIARDELGLIARYGLKYIYPDVVFSTIFDDHSSICTYRDIDRTCASIAAISPRDAEAYRRFAAKSLALLPILSAGLFVAPARQGAFWALLDQSPQGRELMHAAQSSPFDLLTELFEHEKVVIHLAKFISEVLIAPEELGSGIVVYTMPGFMHTHPSGLPEGGSDGLVKALLRCLDASGAVVRSGARVEKLLVESGRAVGVRLAGGEQIRARQAVVGTIHPHLLDQLIDGLDPTLVANAKRTKLSTFSIVAGHFALREAPRYHAQGEAGRAQLVGFAPARLEPFRRIFDEYRYGEAFPRDALMTAMVHSNHDPSRCPPGHATLNVLGFAPYALRDRGPEGWNDLREPFKTYMLDGMRHYASNLDDSNILGFTLQTPNEWPRHTPTFQGGDVGGVGKYLTQFGGHRPTPELSQFSVPGIERFYLTGTFMHPGGGISGSGRATALKIGADLGINLAKHAA